MKIPGVTQRTVLPSGPAAPVQRIQADPDAFGAAIGRAEERGALIGERSAEQASVRILAEQGLKNETEAKDADIEATKRLSDLQYNPDTGYMAKQGKNAVDSYKATIEAAQKIRAETLEKLSSPDAKRMADKVLAARIQSTISSVQSHASVENRKWQLNTSDSRAITELDAASLQFNDDRRFEQALGTARGEAAQQGEMQGWDPATTKLRQQQYEDAGWKKRLETWRMQDPVGALGAYQRNFTRLSPALRQSMGESLFKDAAPVLAEQLNATGGIPIAASDIGKVPPGRLEAGNIDLTNRPVVKNKDGSISTVRSMSFNEGGKEILIPTVSEDGRIMGDEEAIQTYQRTGRHLGKFDKPENATAYAQDLHTDQERRYSGGRTAAERQGKVPASEPRGIRNNNPGNIIQGPSKWQGEIDGGDPRYSSFDTPESGIRALAKNLLAYGDKGLSTVSQIVNRWAPSTENDTKAYIAQVSKELGVDPLQPLNLRDRKVLTQLSAAIIKQENGKQPYEDAQIGAAVGSALDGKPMPAEVRTGAVSEPTMMRGIMNMTAGDAVRIRTGNPVIDALPPDQKIAVFHAARTQASQGAAQAREVLKNRVADSTAAYERGLNPPNAPTPTELITTFGQYDGERLSQDLANARQFGADVQGLAVMPTSQQAVLLASRQPVPGDGFAHAEKRWEQLRAASDRVAKEREADPALFALRYNPGTQEAFKGLSVLMSSPQADPAQKAAASQAYAAASIAEQRRLEIPNLQILPKQMVDAIAKRFTQPAPEGLDTGSIMRGIVDQWGPYWPQVGAQLKKSIPAGAVVIGLGIKPEAEQLLSEALKLKPEQLQQGIDPADITTLKERVRTDFDQLRQTLAWQTNGQETYDNYADSAATMATLLMGKGMKAKDASAKAWESMVGFKYEFEGTWRIPKAALGGGATLGTIRSGAGAALADVAAEAPVMGERVALRIPGGDPRLAGARPEDLEKQWRDTVRDNGFWVTSPGDGGLTLYVKSGLGAQPVLSPEGAPIRRSWAELNGIGSAVRAARMSDVYKKGVRAP